MSITRNRSLIETLKMRDPKMEPCGSPVINLWYLLKLSPILSLFYWWFSVSNALDNPIKLALTFVPYLACSAIFPLFQEERAWYWIGFELISQIFSKMREYL